MMHPLLSVLVVLVAISIIPTVFSDSLRGEFTIPDWIKNMADWWADGQIDDAAFLHAVEFLINEKIVTVQIPVVESEVVEEVPGWVKNTAGWWAEDKIHDFTFVGAIEYLIGQGIMTVDEKQEAEELPPCPDKMISGYACTVKEVVEVNDFYMVVNGGNCCLNWAHVGKDYRFQIETFDKKHGNQIDGVTITAKIISKDGELRHDFGQVTTEDGIYKSIITIPSLDWYAGNILSVTGEYDGVEKTIEKEFEVFRQNNKANICIKISCFVITSVGSMTDDDTKFLKDVRSVKVATIGGSTYVVAAGKGDHGIEVIDISKPDDPTSVGRLLDTDGSSELRGPVQIAIATFGGSTYAVVAANSDNGMDVVDISDPSNPSHVGFLANDSTNELHAPFGVAIATIGSTTYAVVSGQQDDGVEIIDISTDTANPTSVGEVEDGTDSGKCTAEPSFAEGEKCLDGPVEVAIATIGGSTYAVVAGQQDDGVEIIDISTPSSPSSVGRITDKDDTTRELHGANGLAIATIDGSTYAVVSGHTDDGISIIDISIPSSPVYVSELEDGTDNGVCTAANSQRCLDGARGIEIEKIRGTTYAIVTSSVDDAITIIDINTPSSPSIVGTVYNTDTTELNGAKGVAIATIDGATYVVVGAQDDDGIEIIRIMN